MPVASFVPALTVLVSLRGLGVVRDGDEANIVSLDPPRIGAAVSHRLLRPCLHPTRNADIGAARASGGNAPASGGAARASGGNAPASGTCPWRGVNHAAPAQHNTHAVARLALACVLDKCARVFRVRSHRGGGNGQICGIQICVDGFASQYTAMKLTVLIFCTVAGCVLDIECPGDLVCYMGVCKNPKGCPCAPGSYCVVSQDFERCQPCIAGCACPGGNAPCQGCSGGTYSPAGAAACVACPPGTTTDPLYNSGCDPDVYTLPCANDYGPLGHVACRPIPPPQNQTLGFLEPRLPIGALEMPPQYLPGGVVPNQIPPYYDVPVAGTPPFPMLKQSY
jgi:hypothetical protein